MYGIALPHTARMASVATGSFVVCAMHGAMLMVELEGPCSRENLEGPLTRVDQGGPRPLREWCRATSEDGVQLEGIGPHGRRLASLHIVSMFRQRKHGRK